MENILDTLCWPTTGNVLSGSGGGGGTCPPAVPASGVGPKGEEEFGATLRRHAPSVRHYVRSLLPGCADADDIAQETLLKLWEKRAEFTLGTNFKAWAFQTARYLVLNHRKKLARSKVVLIDEELMDHMARQLVAEEPDFIEDELAALEMCRKKLNSEDQKLLHIRYGTNVSLETYAEHEGVRTGMLRARLFRLREALGKCLKSRLPRS
ncbi:sigma-70 family RNA polymerase sigma factor [Verrucomicrobium spinosum]|nr:sigma-70 family RNA polymerase sigma factor [Verrucomicrobium spinosum]